MTDQQSELLASPTRYAYLQQAKEILEEFSVQFNLVPLWCFSLRKSRSSSMPFRGLSRGCCFLFGDGGSYAVEKGEEECKVYGSGNVRSVLEIESCQLRYYALDSTVRR